MTLKLLTPKAAAALAGCSRSRIYDALAKGELMTAPNVEAAVKLLRARDVEAWRAKPKDKGGRPRVPRPQDSFPKRPRAANVRGRPKET